MTSILSAWSATSGVLQSTSGAWPEQALAYLQSDHLSISPPSVHMDVLRQFSTDENLRIAFSDNYAKAASTSETGDAAGGAIPENAQHIALSETITSNRSAFPGEGFVIRTTLPGGGSIETQIPPSAIGIRSTKSSVSLSSADSGSYASALSRIVGAVVLHGHSSSQEIDEATQEQISQLYQ